MFAHIWGEASALKSQPAGVSQAEQVWAAGLKLAGGGGGGGGGKHPKNDEYNTKLHCSYRQANPTAPSD